MAGFILLIAGFLKIGTLISHIPEAVIDGFTVGIAVIIDTSQLQDLLGLAAASVPADFIEKLPALWALRDSFTQSALQIGLAVSLLICCLRRFSPPLQVTLLAGG